MGKFETSISLAVWAAYYYRVAWDRTSSDRGRAAGLGRAASDHQAARLHLGAQAPA